MTETSQIHAPPTAAPPTPVLPGMYTTVAQIVACEERLVATYRGVHGHLAEGPW